MGKGKEKAGFGVFVVVKYSSNDVFPAVPNKFINFEVIEMFSIFEVLEEAYIDNNRINNQFMYPKWFCSLQNVGIEKGDIPDLTKAPSSLLEALEGHLASVEGRKGSTANTPTQSSRSVQRLNFALQLIGKQFF